MGSVFAEGTENGNSEDYVVTYSANEITDIDELLDLALSQNSVRAFSAQENNNEISVTQLLEERTYADNHVEKSMATTNFAIADSNGVQLSGIQARNYGGSSSESGTKSGITVACTLSYTVGFQGQNVYQIDNVTTSVSYNLGSVRPTNGRHSYMAGENNVGRTENFNCTTSSYQSFTLPSTDNNFYPSRIGMAGGIIGQSVVNLSNSSFIKVSAGVSDVDLDDGDKYN